MVRVVEENVKLEEGKAAYWDDREKVDEKYQTEKIRLENGREDGRITEILTISRLPCASGALGSLASLGTE